MIQHQKEFILTFGIFSLKHNHNFKNYTIAGQVNLRGKLPLNFKSKLLLISCKQEIKNCLISQKFQYLGNQYCNSVLKLYGGSILFKNKQKI